VLAAAVDGSLPLARLEQANRRVADLGAWLARRPPVAAPDTTAGAEIARRVIDVVGDVRVRRGVHVLDLTGGPGIAAGDHAPRLVGVLRSRDGSVTAVPVPDRSAVTPGLVEGIGRPVVAVVDGPSPALDAVRSARPDAVVVHVGLPNAWVPDAPSMTLWGDGRAHAEAAADLLGIL
jgi:beta-N-acetylhexosaminidase